MSHISTVKVEMKDRAAIIRAAQKLRLTFLSEGEHRLYNDQKATGLAFKLPEWRYPIVIDPETGVVKYDNYGESWGKQVELDKLVQRYGAEVAIMQAEAVGMETIETELENGDLRLELVDLHG